MAARGGISETKLASLGGDGYPVISSVDKRLIQMKLLWRSAQPISELRY